MESERHSKAGTRCLLLWLHFNAFAPYGPNGNRIAPLFGIEMALRELLLSDFLLGSIHTVCNVPLDPSNSHLCTHLICVVWAHKSLSKRSIPKWSVGPSLAHRNKFHLNFHINPTHAISAVLQAFPWRSKKKLQFHQHLKWFDMIMFSSRVTQNEMKTCHFALRFVRRTLCSSAFRFFYIAFILACHAISLIIYHN